ncbi:prepilin-type N-terminal cleavage/methylation domain-containing protein [Clostridium botulinum]|uniref:Prepilin-type N-terminal cleavage/methylation domain protein n=1 Tax=Clostridium botulinum D str. 1873 TaxID=592027 RepID=A0A9P2LKV1_CLOBO|nr:MULTISPECIES: prepilin-type N-terminal cleavage/methylation domain-containing protein [Clostridium]EES90791.1 prepilin-type N-terminal cleavage/methylation domain protein [Clostridium botulinum D str. 1873]MBO3441949.1 prepilin-type N-terminal cleavage/methylation domain-containing protein [Clostridium haemolyticum]NFV46800.1 prepilin-type N-terminal cleavage/methylation domain-containing protein [Clostridium botulinum]QPW56216.1 prepilin-type N-terminal cleavage/methylation domain-containin
MSIKKGYSLVELLVVLSILFLIIGYCGIKCNKFKEVYSNSIEVDFSNNYILHMLQNSSLYCKNENKSGRLDFGFDNRVKFYCDEKLIKVYEIPKEFKFVNADLFNCNININNLGVIYTACRISYKDKKEKLHDITIRVGSHYVKVK